MSQKTVVVTGGAGSGTGGSGRYISNKLASWGYYVVIWDTCDHRGIEVANSIRSKGHGVAFVHCDVRDESQVAHAVERTVEETGRIDGLVNNAFWCADEQPLLHETTLEDWDKHMSANLRSHFIVCKNVIPWLVKQQESAIVNVGSTKSRRGENGFAAYAAAKAGLESLTRSIAAQYGRFGLRCNCVVPGPVLNDQMEAMLSVVPEAAAPFVREDEHALLPRGHGEGANVADAVEFLISDAAQWITGESLVVDGGLISHAPSWASARQ